MKRYLYLAIALLLLSLLSACGPAPTPQEEAKPVEVAEQPDTPQPDPTDTPEPAQPAISKEEALKKWGAPFLSSVFGSVLCQQLTEKPEGINQIMITAGLIPAAKMIEEWKPTADQAEIDQALKAAIQGLNEAGKSPDMSSAVAEICPQFETVMNDIQVKAAGDGLTDDDFKFMLEEMQKQLEESK